MLHQRFAPGIRFLHAHYSEMRNDVCLKNGLAGTIAFHVTKDTRLIAATEYTAGNKQFPHFSDAVSQGDLFLSTARIGNYDSNDQGLIGSIDAAEWHKIKEEHLIDTMDELLSQFNDLSDRNEDVAGHIKKFKEFMSPYLVAPEDSEQKMRSQKVEQFKTFDADKAPLLKWSTVAMALGIANLQRPH